MDTTLSLPISKEMVEAIDRWRGRQPGVPSRSEAIRRMIQNSLDSGFTLATKDGGEDGQ